MTIYHSLLSRGYFPKELPPAFFTEQFAQYAVTKAGRANIASYKPNGNFTECAKYSLALPGLERRELKIPHPFSYSQIATLSSKNLSRLLKKAAGSKCSMSRPIYSQASTRAIKPMLGPSNLARERAAARAGASFFLACDISQFYPSLYTHAVGWAVDPKLRDKKFWKSTNLLGKKLDQALMDLDGKMSQGIPIGPDISFLLAEVVLGQVDKALKLPAGQSVRWFDDYQIAFDSRHEAEITLKRLIKELARYRLRLNPKKTRIVALPRPTQDEWQAELSKSGSGKLTNPRALVRYFDIAFRIRETHPDAAVLQYALGTLFKISAPSSDVGRIAQSCITQALLSEPGVAQKAFALLSFWGINGFSLNAGLIRHTIEQLILRHESSGLSSDVAWALAFCINQGIALGSRTAKHLSILEDGCIAIQALHMNAKGL